MTKKEKEKEQKEAYEVLKQYHGQQLAASVKSVSRSGMSRKIEFYAPNFDRIGYYIAKLLDYPYYPGKGIKVDGCGMDMIFSVLSDLNYEMAKRDTGKTIQELLKTGECGTHIYDKYFTDANHYKYL